jgi:hypothetical protein
LKFGKVDDAKIPGDLLGTYSVTGSLVKSSCGDGGLAATDPWSFEVKLSRFHEDLYWINGREVIPGDIDPDGVTFAFSTRVEGEVVPAGRGRAACTLNRADSAEGHLSSETLDVEGFDATLRFDFSPLEGSDCEAIIGTPEGVPGLPCSVSYDLTGKRKGEAPAEEK